MRLTSVAMTSFRDACAQPGLSLPEIARVVDWSVARAIHVLGGRKLDDDVAVLLFEATFPSARPQDVPPACGTGL